MFKYIFTIISIVFGVFFALHASSNNSLSTPPTIQCPNMSIYNTATVDKTKSVYENTPLIRGWSEESTPVTYKGRVWILAIGGINESRDDENAAIRDAEKIIKTGKKEGYPQAPVEHYFHCIYYSVSGGLVVGRTKV